MRITANLSLFFHDHRALSKLFIKEEFKCIQDVEERISEVFHIYNFYLKCDNQYLPPSEDVGILGYDDIVWVIPNNEAQFVAESDVEIEVPVDEEQEVVEKKEKKKKKKRKRESEDASLESRPKKHKKKRDKHLSEENNEEITQDLEGHNENERKKSKSKKHKKTSKDVISEDIVSRDSGRDSFDGSKSDGEVENQNFSVKSLVNSFENKNALKQCLDNSFTLYKKRTNIVKSIIISNNKSTPDQKPIELNENTNLNTELLSSKPKISNETESSQEVVEIEECIEGPSKESDVMNSSYDSPFMNNCRKRKRKRVHRRKNTCKNSETECVKEPEAPIIPQVLFPKLVNGKHIRFKENVDIISSPNIPAASDEDNTKYIPTEQHIVAISEEDTKENTKEKQVEETETVNNVIEVVANNELTESFILKQPLMLNMQPRVGDIIAFKILRISEQYTPEISSWIVGKVSTFDTQNLELTFEIIHGKEQCQEPQGKFSFKSEEEEEPVTNVLQCIWSNILDARYLYP